VENVRKLGEKRESNNRVHVFIATPAYDGKVDSNFSQSIAEAAFCCPLYQVYMTASVMGNGAFIDLARNVFVRMFLDKFKEATHLFFIASDLKFEPRSFIGLLKSGLPICAGVYRRRQEPEDYPAQLAPHPEKGGLWVEDGFVMHKRVPTGFLCIRRDVIEEMAKDAPQMTIHGQDGPVPRLFYTKLSDDNRFVGEDYAFCDDYIERYGRPIPVWPDMEFQHGTYKGNYGKWLTEQIEAEENRSKEGAAERVAEHQAASGEIDKLTPPDAALAAA